jgi:hypothetical protein
LLPLYNAKSQKVQIRLAQILPTLRFYLFADLFIDRGGSFERPVQQNNTPGDPRRHYKRKKRCTVVCICKIGSFYFRRKHFLTRQRQGFPHSFFTDYEQKSRPPPLAIQPGRHDKSFFQKREKTGGRIIDFIAKSLILYNSTDKTKGLSTL